MQFATVFALGALQLAQAQYVPPPSPVLLSMTKSGVLPVLPTPFNGTLTLQGAIIVKAPANNSYLPVNGPAAVQSNLPAVTYVATLPAVPFNALTGTVIRGTVTGSSKQGDTGVTFTFNLTGLPDVATYGPFAYHIHDMPVPADGNCTSTLGHFDYTNAGEYYTCPLNATQNCQTGDLSGKHGKINGTTFSVSFNERYVSTQMGSPYFFGSKSITFHTANTTRITCANFVMAASNGTTGGATATTSSAASGTSSATRTTSSGAVFTGAAGKTMLGSGVAGLALLFALFL